MSIRSKLILVFGLMLVLAVGVTIYGIQAVSHAGELVVRLYDQSFMAASHARAAQGRFSDARAAMERALLQRDAMSPAALNGLASAMNDIVEDLKVVGERMEGAKSLNAIQAAKASVQEWYKEGLAIIKPPVDGVLS